MNKFHEMLRKTSSSPYYNSMMRSAAPLNDCFGINHFWYYKITSKGHYAYLGTHTDWSEFCFDKAMVSHFPCLRHPNSVKSGVQLMKAGADVEYKQVLDTAWDKYKINFNINLIEAIPEGIEAFGFASRFNDPLAEERLLNQLPILHYFTKCFRAENEKLFQLLNDNQVDLSSEFGPVFYERPKALALPDAREQLLRRMGFEWIFSLSQREKEIMGHLRHGYPASYVAEKLHLSCRTVENYIAIIKSKLSCRSKVELIQKARELASTGYFE